MQPNIHADTTHTYTHRKRHTRKTGTDTHTNAHIRHINTRTVTYIRTHTRKYAHIHEWTHKKHARIYTRCLVHCNGAIEVITLEYTYPRSHARTQTHHTQRLCALENGNSSDAKDAFVN